MTPPPDRVPARYGKRVEVAVPLRGPQKALLAARVKHVTPGASARPDLPLRTRNTQSRTESNVPAPRGNIN